MELLSPSPSYLASRPAESLRPGRAARVRFDYEAVAAVYRTVF